MESKTELEVSELLFEVITNNKEITNEYIELSLKYRLFSYTSYFLLKFKNFENINNWIINLLNSPIQLNDDFNKLILVLVYENFDIRPILKEISNFNEINSQFFLPLIFYNYLKFNEYPENFKNYFQQNNNENLIIYNIFLNILIEESKKILNGEFFNITTIEDSLNDSNIIKRLTELSNSIISITKNLNKTPFKTFINSFILNFDLILNLIKEKIEPKIKKLLSLKAFSSLFLIKINLIESSFNWINLTFLKKNFNNNLIFEFLINNLLNKNFTYFKNQIYIIQLINLINNNNNNLYFKYFKLNILKDLKSYNLIINEPINIINKLNSKDSILFQTFQNLSNSLLFTYYFSQCSLLETKIYLNISLFANNAKIYPKQQINNILENLSKNNLNLYNKLLDEKIQINEFILQKINDFLLISKNIPGTMKSIDFNNFIPPFYWNWPKIIGYEFPNDPLIINQILDLNEKINEELEFFKLSLNIPHCKFENCINNATCVCPYCSLLVLCHKHHKKIKNCPICQNLI